MNRTEWFAVVGLITGVLGFGLSVFTHVFTRKTKALDLRLELRKAASDVRATVSGLPDLIDRVAKWTESVAAARGHFQSGVTEKSRARVQQDREQAAVLAARLPPAVEAYAGHNHAELESALVSIHELKRDANVLVARYEKDLASFTSQEITLRKK